MAGPDQKQSLVASQLKERGWTGSLIKKFLPVPDETRKNPHYRSAPPMKLYLLERVVGIEASTEFQQEKEHAPKRKASAGKAVETKLEKLKTHLDQMRMEVPKLARDEVIKRACRHCNRRKLDVAIERGFEYTPASADSEPIFLERIWVNYLRHVLSNYEDELARVYGRVGVGQAYKEISRKIYDAISEAYAWLGDECRRQLERKLSEQSG